MEIPKATIWQREAAAVACARNPDDSIYAIIRRITLAATRTTHPARPSPAMALTIFNWNIEQFGKTRSAYPNRVNRACEVIKREEPDVATIIEVKSKKVSAVLPIANRLVQVLGQMGTTYRYVLSHHNRLETHLYLYNPATVVPLVLVKGTRVVYSEVELAKENLVEADDVSTTSMGADAAPTLFHYFPLLSYPQREDTHRPLCAGFFREKATKTPFCVISWHNEAGSYRRTNSGVVTSDARPAANLKKLAAAPFITKGYVQVQVQNQPTSVSWVVLTGDFNVNAQLKAAKQVYATLGGYTTKVGKRTYLNKYVKASKPEFYTACYDNFIVSQALENARKMLVHVVDVPEWLLKTGTKALKAMIEESSLADPQGLIEVTRSLNDDVVTRLADQREFGYVKVGQRAELRELVARLALGSWKTAEPGFRTQAMNIVQDRKQADAIVGALAERIGDNVAEMNTVLQRFSDLLRVPSSADLGDTTFLMLTILSDHLPVYLKVL